MSTVFVIGAGASYGEMLIEQNKDSRPHRPPLAKSFFDNGQLKFLKHTEAQGELTEVIAYIRRSKLIAEPFGEGRWQQLDLEEVFTALEVEREFHNPESDEGARLLLVRNSLVRYIRGILGRCTLGSRGKYYRLLTQKLEANDSIVTFNWDLLLDQEFLDGYGRLLPGPYSNFVKKGLLSVPQNILPGVYRGEGLFLKLHGSLNWFRCGNHKCEASRSLRLFPQTQVCLDWNRSGEEVTCWQCGGITNPVIIPPLLRKPVMEDPAIRSTWGLARQRLLDASRIVLVGSQQRRQTSMPVGF